MLSDWAKAHDLLAILESLLPLHHLLEILPFTGLRSERPSLTQLSVIEFVKASRSVILYD